MLPEIERILISHGMTIVQVDPLAESCDDPLFAINLHDDEGGLSSICVFIQGSGIFADTYMIWYEVRGVMKDACIIDDASVVLEKIDILKRHAATH